MVNQLSNELTQIPILSKLILTNNLDTDLNIFKLSNNNEIILINPTNNEINIKLTEKREISYFIKYIGFFMNNSLDLYSTKKIKNLYQDIPLEKIELTKKSQIKRITIIITNKKKTLLNFPEELNNIINLDQNLDSINDYFLKINKTKKCVKKILIINKTEKTKILNTNDLNA